MTEGEHSSTILREVATVYGAVLAVIVVAAIIAPFVGVLGQFLYALVAALFYFVPQKLIEKRGWEFEAFGIHQKERLRGVIWGAVATAITVPFFMGGLWVWETQVLERTLQPDASRYRQFDADLQGKPAKWGDKAGVWVWAERSKLHVGLANRSEPNHRVKLKSATPFEFSKRGSVSVRKVSDTEAEVVLTHSKSRGTVVFEHADDVEISIEPVVAGEPSWTLFAGPDAKKVEKVDASRGYLWLLLWIATQLLLVALPEEYFYRGYIQTRLKRAFELRREEGKSIWKGAFIFTPSIVFTSVLFGIGHLIVPVGGAVFATRMTVLFPSLVFGWLRDRTGSILASTIYHTCCNLMVLLGAVHFV